MSSIEQKYAKRWMTAQKNKQKIDNFNYQKHLLIHHHYQEVIENRADANAWKKKKDRAKAYSIIQKLLVLHFNQKELVN